MIFYHTYQYDPVRQAKGTLPQQNTKTGLAAGAPLKIENAVVNCLKMCAEFNYPKKK